MQGKANNCARNEEDAVKVGQELEEIIKNNKVILYGWSTIQVKYFKKFKEKDQFVSMVLKFGVS